MTLKSVHPYKIDNRTEKEFLEDMKKGLKREVEAINVFRQITKSNRPMHNPELIYVGSEEEGKIVFDEKNRVANVDLFPDYLLKYKDNRTRIRASFIEVKVCNPHSRECYFKVKQLSQYEELGNVLILFVMGIATKNPEFVIVSPNSILEMGIEPEEVYGKKTIKAPKNRFNWLPFTPELKIDEHLLYREYIKG